MVFVPFFTSYIFNINYSISGEKIVFSSIIEQDKYLKQLFLNGRRIEPVLRIVRLNTKFRYQETK